MVVQGEISIGSTERGLPISTREGSLLVLFADGSSRKEETPFCCWQLCSEWSDGHRPQSVDPVQDEGEELSGHSHFGQLEDDVPGVPHDPVADLPP